MGFRESRLFNITVEPSVYFRDVGDTVVSFCSELECYRFHVNFNQLHPAVNFTIEKEQSNSLNFLDVSMEKVGTGLLTPHVQETNVYWSIHPLEFLQPKSQPYNIFIS